MQAILLTEHGPAEKLVLREVPTPEPREGEVVVKNAAIGVNFVDTQHRAGGYYPDVVLPRIIGIEAAGTVAAIGPGVSGVRIGDRVAYTGGAAYAEYTAVRAERAIPVPANVPLQQAAAVLLQGMTAHYLAHSAFPLKSGRTALVHAAAGGVGLLLVQFAKGLGATVIGVVSNEEKAALAREAGADHVIVGRDAPFAALARELTDGGGVDVVYDAVGGPTFEGSLLALRTRGTLVLYGQAGGIVPPIDVRSLARYSRPPNNGSLFLTWPSLDDYTSTPEELRWRAGDLFAGLANNSLKLHVAATFPLAEAAAAHRLLESGAVAGKVVLRTGAR